MGLSKTEINLKRLLSAAPHQQNQAKLIHYVATLREQLELLGEERIPEGLPRVSKALLSEYSEKIEELADKLVAPKEPIQEVQEPNVDSSSSEASPKAEKGNGQSMEGLRRRLVSASSPRARSRDSPEEDPSSPIKLDAGAKQHIDKHRKLQEDLTDEMVILARQLKESSVVMSQSINNTDKILDSTEKAVEHSLASTGHANTRAMNVYSQSFKTSCFTWLLMFMMTCIFVMVVLLIRVT
ncbi:hypothetical protein Leryth_004070 [Lithospermum erythrorhizon]|nr:hypothetical protein Leryth_004070 [Lithospermum erythrorhizon]